MSPTQREYVRYKVMQALEVNPHASQRELATELGVSLGAVNFCLKALVEKGMVKVENFVRSNNKVSYAYYLTPRGVFEKSEITAEFLKRKKQEYALLKAEIEELQAEVAKQAKSAKTSQGISSGEKLG